MKCLKLSKFSTGMGTDRSGEILRQDEVLSHSSPVNLLNYAIPFSELANLRLLSLRVSF